MEVQRIINGGPLCGNAVAAAIRRGDLAPARDFTCTDCTNPATAYDHRNYNFPLAVEPVCRPCNAKRGKAIPRRWAEGELLARLKRSARRFRIVPWAVETCFSRAESTFLRIEHQTNGSITRHALRPDLFDELNDRRELDLGPNPYEIRATRTAGVAMAQGG